MFKIIPIHVYLIRGKFFLVSSSLSNFFSKLYQPNNPLKWLISSCKWQLGSYSFVFLYIIKIHKNYAPRQWLSGLERLPRKRKVGVRMPAATDLKSRKNR